jgi:rhodanese-related sulfurtransferase
MMGVWTMPLNLRRFAGLAAVMLALLVALPPGSAQDASSKTIVFVCQHGVVNSQMAAAYFNRIARERGLPFTAVSRGIDSAYRSVPVRIEDGLALDGLTSANSPRELTADEAGRAGRVLAFDTIPADLRGGAVVTYWSGIPLGINDYEATRDEIIRHIDALIPTLADELAK